MTLLHWIGGAAVATVIAVGVSAVRPADYSVEPPTARALAMSAPYRDGLFVGQLHRNQGLKQHITWGRWSRETDRQAFIAGYKQGYGEKAAEDVAAR